MAGERELLFVYGTLKRGFGNHWYLEKAKFLGNAETVEKYALYEVGIPYVVKEEKISTIKGEVYEVGRAELTAIDKLEGHPKYYRREKVRVRVENGDEVEAWFYFLNSENEFDRVRVVRYGRLNISGEYKG